MAGHHPVVVGHHLVASHFNGRDRKGWHPIQQFGHHSAGVHLVVDRGVHPAPHTGGEHRLAGPAFPAAEPLNGKALLLVKITQIVEHSLVVGVESRHQCPVAAVVNGVNSQLIGERRPRLAGGQVQAEDMALAPVGLVDGSQHPCRRVARPGARSRVEHHH